MSYRNRKTLGEVPSVAAGYPYPQTPSVSPQILIRDRYGNRRLVQSTGMPDLPRPYVRDAKWDPRQPIAGIPSVVSILSGPERSILPSKMRKSRANHAGRVGRGEGWGFGLVGQQTPVLSRLLNLNVLQFFRNRRRR